MSGLRNSQVGALLALGLASIGGGSGFSTADRSYEPPNTDRMSNRQKAALEKSLRRRARQEQTP